MNYLLLKKGKTKEGRIYYALYLKNVYKSGKTYNELITFLKAETFYKLLEMGYPYEEEETKPNE